MTRRKPLSKRLTALSLAKNLTEKQEHQLVAAADRARHLEADLAALRDREERIRALLVTPGAVLHSRYGTMYTPMVTVDALENALNPEGSS